MSGHVVAVKWKTNNCLFDRKQEGEKFLVSKRVSHHLKASVRLSSFQNEEFAWNKSKKNLKWIYKRRFEMTVRIFVSKREPFQNFIPIKKTVYPKSAGRKFEIFIRKNHSRVGRVFHFVNENFEWGKQRRNPAASGWIFVHKWGHKKFSHFFTTTTLQKFV